MPARRKTKDLRNPRDDHDPPENEWVAKENERNPANPTHIPEGLEDEAPMTDAMSAWIRANCKFAKSV